MPIIQLVTNNNPIVVKLNCNYIFYRMKKIMYNNSNES